MSGRAITLRLGPLSQRLAPRAIYAGLVFTVLLLAVTALSLRAGVYPLGLSEILSVLAGGGDDISRMIVWDHRLPRILTGMGAGMAFGVAGAMFQMLLRNPLASPDVIGFSAGASTGAVASIVLTGGTAYVLGGTLIGGVVAAFLVLVLSWQRGIQPYRMILVGIGVSLSLSTLSDLLMTRIDLLTAADVAKWLVGTLNTRSWDDVAQIWAGLVLLLPLALWKQFALARLAMSDDLATGLGLRLGWSRALIVGLAVALVGFAVSVAGPLPFVAFVAGPIARALAGPGRPALLSAAMVGAVVTMASDWAARSVLGDLQLPAGVFTALIGAPVLLWILATQFRRVRL